MSYLSMLLCAMVYVVIVLILARFARFNDTSRALDAAINTKNNLTISGPYRRKRSWTKGR